MGGGDSPRLGRGAAAILDVVPEKPPTTVALRWTGGLIFEIAAGERQSVTDGDGKAGLSPVEMLAASLAGCMASDVAWILGRGRQDLRGLDVRLSADRAPEDPRRFVAIRVHFAATGDVAQAQLDRAIALSHDKYCSVWHTLRQDLSLELTSSITPSS